MSTHLTTDLSPVSIQTQSLALRKRKPQETQVLAFLTGFVYATHATQAIAFEWKPGFRTDAITALRSLAQNRIGELKIAPSTGYL